MVILVPGFERSWVQPNPGWGVLCEICVHRICRPPNSSDCPCAKDAWIERQSSGGRDVSIYDEYGVDFTEDCNAFSLALEV